MKRIDLPSVIIQLVDNHGAEIRGRTPTVLLEKTRFYSLECRDALYSLMPKTRFGITIGRKVYIMPESTERLMKAPSLYSPKIWHELVHVAQWLDKSAATFLFDYAWSYLTHFGNWKKVYLEQEAFNEEARFKRDARV